MAPVVTVGNTHQTSEQIAANTFAIFEQLQESFPHGLTNIKTVVLKCPHSVPIPVFISLKQHHTVSVPHVKPKDKQGEPATGELSTLPGREVTVYPGGRIDVRNKMTPEDKEFEKTMGQESKYTKMQRQLIEYGGPHEDDPVESEMSDSGDEEMDSEELPSPIEETDLVPEKETDLVPEKETDLVPEKETDLVPEKETDLVSPVEEKKLGPKKTFTPGKKPLPGNNLGKKPVPGNTPGKKAVPGNTPGKKSFAGKNTGKKFSPGQKPGTKPSPGKKFPPGQKTSPGKKLANQS